MKTLKTLMIAAVALIVTSQSYSQALATDLSIKFINGAILPYPIAYSNCVTDGRYLYSVAGYRGLGLGSQVLRYDAGSNQWRLLANLKSEIIQTGAAYVPATNKIYVMGGVAGAYKDATVNRHILSVDLKTGAVEQLNVENPMPSIKTALVEWDNKIYLFGGSRDAKRTTNEMYCFDPQTQKFTRLANVPDYLETSAAVVNGVIYTFGGYDNFTKRQSDVIYAYDIKNNKWSKAGKLPETVSEDNVAVRGNEVFVVGSHDNEDFIGKFDTRTNQFTRLKSNLERRKSAGVGMIYDRLVVFGGTTRFQGPSRLFTLQTTQVADLRSFVAMNK